MECRCVAEDKPVWIELVRLWRKCVFYIQGL